MEKERFDYVCVQTEQGRDEFVWHPPSGEEGRVLNCSGDKVVFENTKGEQRTFDYHELEQVTRSKEEWPRRD
jgi:hypothetical protein